jgi:hypothetical protein
MDNIDDVNKIKAFFNQYGWNLEQQDEITLVSRFEGDSNIVFSVYVVVNEDWIIITISPFVANVCDECRIKLSYYLAQLNYHVMLAKFSMADRGDVILTVELPLPGLTFDAFVIGLEALCFYADDQFQLITELGTNLEASAPKFEDFG